MTLRRDRRVFVASLVLFALLAIPVDRDRTSHIEVRELRWWEVPVLVAALLGAAFLSYGTSRFGPWSFIRILQRLNRDLAIAFLAAAAVVALYGVSLMFR